MTFFHNLSRLTPLFAAKAIVFSGLLLTLLTGCASPAGNETAGRKTAVLIPTHNAASRQDAQPDAIETGENPPFAITPVPNVSADLPPPMQTYAGGELGLAFAYPQGWYVHNL